MDKGTNMDAVNVMKGSLFTGHYNTVFHVEKLKEQNLSNAICLHTGSEQ